MLNYVSEAYFAILNSPHIDSLLEALRFGDLTQAEKAEFTKCKWAFQTWSAPQVVSYTTNSICC